MSIELPINLSPSFPDIELKEFLRKELGETVVEVYESPE